MTDACELCGGVGMLQIPLSMPAPNGSLYRFLNCKCQSDEVIARRARIPARYAAAHYRELDQFQAKPGRAPSALLMGPPGRGKTWFACGLLKSYCRNIEYGGLFVDLQDLEQKRRAAVARADRLPGDEYLLCPYLVADDLGRNERLTDFWLEWLTSLICTRYNQELSTVFTTNFSLDDLTQKLGAHLAGRVKELTSPNHRQLTNKDWRAL